MGWLRHNIKYKVITHTLRKMHLFAERDLNQFLKLAREMFMLLEVCTLKENGNQVL